MKRRFPFVAASGQCRGPLLCRAWDRAHGGVRPEARATDSEIAASDHVRARDPSAAMAEDAVGGDLILNDWSARDLQREGTSVRPRAKTSRAPQARQEGPME